jgi:hypothetical protein
MDFDFSRGPKSSFSKDTFDLYTYYVRQFRDQSYLFFVAIMQIFCLNAGKWQLISNVINKKARKGALLLWKKR